MSAIREVKYLRELRHQNVIEVRGSGTMPMIQAVYVTVIASRRFFFQDQPKSCSRVPRF
jgi:hypothetical protein